jgi:hypothetical protein
LYRLYRSRSWYRHVAGYGASHYTACILKIDKCCPTYIGLSGSSAPRGSHGSLQSGEACTKTHRHSSATRFRKSRVFLICGLVDKWNVRTADNEWTSHHELPLSEDSKPRGFPHHAHKSLTITSPTYSHMLGGTMQQVGRLQV